ncbi:phage tail protein [Citrobacter freundii]|uniref:phage tail protein n=6 Tax=Citrobacter freundii complex TaxID=1344959 RepID=UPI003C74AC93
MSAKFYTLLTDIGAAKLASAAALGVPLKITHMAVGSGGGVLPTPNAQQTALVAEERRAALNMLYIDPQNSSQIIAEQVIPENEGGWWIREVGLFDETGALIAVGNCPESYKPKLAEGSGRTQTVRMVLITSSTDNITLKIDPAVVLATRKYVDDKALELKVYVDDLMAKHLAAVDPHSQYAPKDSPTLTGTPKAPTAAAGNNSVQIANTAFVQAAILALIGGAPATLDTLKEIAAAINNDPNFSTTINNALALKAPLASPTLTGTPKAPTAAAGNNSVQIANTAFVQAAILALIGGAPATLDTLKEIAAAINNDPNFSTTINNALALKAPLASPALTGAPTAPTAVQSTNNTQIATTAFVKSAVAGLVGSSPEALDTLNELAAALGNDPNFATTVMNALAGKQPLDATLTNLSGKSISGLLEYLGLGKTDSPEFGGLKAPSITLRDGKISFLSSEDGKIIAITVNGESVAEIKTEHIFHKRALVAGEFLQAPKLIFRDGDINFYSGPGNLVMQVGGNDVATLTPGSFYHVKQVAAAESLKAPKVILRDGDVNLVGGENNLVIQVGGNDIASLTPGNNFFKGKLTAETSLQVGSTCILATDGNLTGSKWGGWLDAFMKDGMSTDGNGLWWDAFSSQLQFRVGDWNIPDAAGGAGTSVTFPKAFKNGCLMVIPIPGNGGSSQQIGSQSYSASGAVLQKGASDNNPRSGKYLAIGY